MAWALPRCSGAVRARRRSISPPPTGRSRIIAPALLNLATVARQYLRDNALALQNYRAYLALTPHRADWDQVNAIANDLEQQMNGAANPSRSNRQAVSRRATATEYAGLHRSAGPSVANLSDGAPMQSSTASPTRESSAARQRIRPLPRKRRRSQTNEKPRRSAPAQSVELVSRRVAGAESDATGAVAIRTTITVKPAPEPEASNLTAFGTPMHTQTKPFRLVQPAPPAFPRYLYLSPARPAAGRPAGGRARVCAGAAI